MNRIRELAGWLEARDDIAIVSHVNPDGDAVGSSLGVMFALEQLGKRCFVSLAEPAPETYRYLPRFDSIVLPEDAPFAPRYVLVVDCAGRDRVGSAVSLIDGAEGFASLDHHRTSEPYGEVSVLDISAAATAELIMRLIDALGVELTPGIALCLYTGIIYDTGNFAHSNTTAQTLRYAARCADFGLDVASLNYRLFRERSASRTRLLGNALSGIEYLHAGRVALIRVTAAMKRACGATSEDTEKIVNYGVETVGVEVSLLAEEIEGGTQLALRSRAYVDVSAVAAALHGGGHARASGATVKRPMEAVIRDALALIGRALEAGV